MTEQPPLALRHGQSEWEDELWLRELVHVVLTGERPTLPVIVDLAEWAQVQAIIAAEMAARCCLCGADMTGRGPGMLTARGAAVCQQCLDGLPNLTSVEDRP